PDRRFLPGPPGRGPGGWAGGPVIRSVTDHHPEPPAGPSPPPPRRVGGTILGLRGDVPLRGGRTAARLRGRDRKPLADVAGTRGGDGRRGCCPRGRGLRVRGRPGSSRAGNLPPALRRDDQPATRLSWAPPASRTWSSSAPEHRSAWLPVRSDEACRRVSRRRTATSSV